MGRRGGRDGGGTEPSPGALRAKCYLGRLTGSNSGSEKGRENGKGEVSTPAESR